MAELPLNVSTGMVFGRFIAAVIDKEDTNQEPDVIPAQGSITFTASVPYLPNPGATPDPLTILKTPIKAVLDDEGYLCTPHPLTGVAMYRGVRLIATDDPDLLVTGWTWNVVYKFDMVEGLRPQIQDHSLLVPSDAEVDLTTAVKVPASVGYGLPQAEAAAVRASADATTATEAALRAEQVAQVTDAGVATLLIDPATETGGALVNALAGKADLTGGKVPVGQLPTDSLVTDANVAAVIDGAQTGAALKSGFIQRRFTGVLYEDSNGYVLIKDESSASGSTLRLEDTPNHDGSILHLAHRGGAVGTGQAYGINLANYTGAKGGFIGHQYSKVSPFMQIDNTDLNASIYIRNTPNTTMNPGGVQTGDFFQLKPGSETSNRLILKDNLTFWNQTSLDFKVQADNATNYAFGVQTSKDIRALVVTKSGTGTGAAVEVNNAGTQPGIWVKQTGAGNGLYVEGNKPEQFGKAAARFLGNTHAAQFDVNADGGSAMLINKTSTGNGDAVRIVNSGTGPSIDFRNAGGAVAKVNPNGEYEHLTAGAGIVLKSPNGTRYRVTVSDSGTLTTVPA